MSSQLLTMHPRKVRRLGPGPSVTYSGPLGNARYSRNYTVGGLYAGTYPFQVRIPSGYSNSTPMGVVLMMAPNGRGNDGTSMMSDTMNGSMDSYDYNVITAFCQWQNIGSNGGREQFYPMIPAVLAVVASEWNVDTSRLYMMGWSLGGLLVMEGLWLYPTTFAAVMIAEAFVAPGGLTVAGATVSPSTTTQAATVVATTNTTTKVRQFENLDDGTVAPATAQTVGDGFTAAGNANLTYTTQPTGGHDPSLMMASAGATYVNGWMLAQHR